MENEWLATAHELILQRNKRESAPFLEVYTANATLFKKCVYLESVRVATKHSLAILEHETADLLNKGELEQTIKNVTSKFQHIHQELQSYHNRNTNKSLTNLSKVIYDQRKHISNLEEEIRMAKTQITDAFTTLASTQEQNTIQTAQNIQLQEEISLLHAKLAEQEARIDKLQTENESLTDRIITEKNKSAQQLDEMNKLLSNK